MDGSTQFFSVISRKCWIFVVIPAAIFVNFDVIVEILF